MNNNYNRSENDLFKGLGILIELENPDDFLIVKETLTRIGVCSRNKKILTQSVNLFHRQNSYCLMHFLEMFKFENRPSNIVENDLARRNTIAKLLMDWKLVKIHPSELERIQTNMLPLNQIKIISFKEKKDYELRSKFTVGKKKYY